MSETRPVVLLGGAIAILAVFLSRFRPAWLLLTETAQPALVASAVVLAMLAIGMAALMLARRLFQHNGEIPLLDGFAGSAAPSLVAAGCRDRPNRPERPTAVSRRPFGCPF